MTDDELEYLAKFILNLNIDDVDVNNVDDVNKINLYSFLFPYYDDVRVSFYDIKKSLSDRLSVKQKAEFLKFLGKCIISEYDKCASKGEREEFHKVFGKCCGQEEMSKYSNITILECIRLDDNLRARATIKSKLESFITLTQEEKKQFERYDDEPLCNQFFSCDEYLREEIYHNTTIKKVYEFIRLARANVMANLIAARLENKRTVGRRQLNDFDVSMFPAIMPKSFYFVDYYIKDYDYNDKYIDSDGITRYNIRDWWWLPQYYVWDGPNRLYFDNRIGEFYLKQVGNNVHVYTSNWFIGIEEYKTIKLIKSLLKQSKK